MFEFDDPMSQVLMIKKRMEDEGYSMETLDFHPEYLNKYNYIVHRRIYSLYEFDRFRERVRESYIDLSLRADEDNYIPDLYQIVDDIDEENILIIEEFYRMYNIKGEELDTALAKYFQDIHSYLDDWVADILRQDGVPFIGMTEMERFQKKHELLANLGPQNILFEEMLN